MKIRKAILTGGGRATRLRPLTSTTNKHLLPLAGKLMIYHAIEKVVEVGIEEIYINTNAGGDEALVEAVGDGSRWGVKITFFEQKGGPLGIAHVVNQAKDFIGDEPFIFYLSDNIILGSLNGLMDKFEEGNYDCMLALSKVPDPERFGVPVFSVGGRLVDVVEKPKDPPSDFAVTGIYMYGAGVFFDAFQNIRMSERGEYEISDIHAYFLREGKKVGFDEITGWWKDTGKVPDLLLANELLMTEMGPDKFVIGGVMEGTVKVEGKVTIGKGSFVKGVSRMVGPVIVGEGVIIDNSEVGPFVTVGDNSEISNAKIDNSIILQNVTIKSKKVFRECLLGNKTKIMDNDSRKAVRMVVGDQTEIEM